MVTRIGSDEAFADRLKALAAACADLRDSLRDQESEIMNLQSHLASLIQDVRQLQATIESADF
jgi:septal ring factor EnvC (AmiA/AmiB activator)